MKKFFKVFDDWIVSYLGVASAMGGGTGFGVYWSQGNDILAGVFATLAFIGIICVLWELSRVIGQRDSLRKQIWNATLAEEGTYETGFPDPDDGPTN